MMGDLLNSLLNSNIIVSIILTLFLKFRNLDTIKRKSEPMFKKCLKVITYSAMMILSAVKLLRSNDSAPRNGFSTNRFTSNVGKQLETQNFMVEKTEGTNLDAVVGEEVKAEVMDLVDILMNPQPYQNMGAKTPKGVLMDGPPGTGKTMLARAIANHAKANMYYVSGSSFNQTFVGVGSNRMVELFEKAQSTKPSIIFIDEIDSIGKKRSGRHGMSNDDRESTLNTLLTQMDGFNENNGVLVIGATNRKSILDSALLRPGRFDRTVTFELPNKKERKQMFLKLLNKMKISKHPDIDFINKYNQSGHTTPERYAEALSRLTTGMSGAEVSKVCNEAIIKTVKSRKKTVGWKELESALDYTILGPEKRMKIISDEQKWIVSYHETGHAMVAYLLPDAVNPNKVSIIPRGNHILGFSQSSPEEEKMLHSEEELLAHMQVLIAGRVAEKIQFQSVTTGAQDDLIKLTNTARNIVTKYGMDASFGNFYIDENKQQHSQKTLEQVDAIVSKMIKNVEEKVTKLIQNNIKAFHAIAKCLYENETLLKEDIESIVKLLKR